MPNWCDTTYKCVGNPKEVRKLYDVIKANDKRTEPRVNNGFGTLWLGCIIDQLGEDWEQFRCRGEITWYELNDKGNILTICQNTAWCEQEGFRKCIEKVFPSIKVFYREEEPGCEVFCTNDAKAKFFPDRYLLDCYDNPMYFETLGEAAEYVMDIVGHQVEATTKAIDEALDEYVEEHEDEDVFYSFHEFKIVTD